MDEQVGGGSLRRSISGGSVSERKNAPENGSAESGRWTSTSRPSIMSGDRTVKRLRLSKALTIPENTTVREACRRMAARRVDAVLLTDSNALLCGILTDKLCEHLISAPLSVVTSTIYFLHAAETQSLTDLITCILHRVGDDIDKSHLPQILYEDEDHDKVILASNGDLVAAVDHARQAGLKVGFIWGWSLLGCSMPSSRSILQSIRLHLDHSGVGRRKKGRESGSLEYAHKDAWAAAYSTVAAGAAFVAGIGVMAYLKRSAA
ncbi:hypothetical protein BHE74_00002592 [Ensete ventricosum]|nr:hypothetical protein BHE74_00002592 [Ensete ventricosum]